MTALVRGVVEITRGADMVSIKAMLPASDMAVVMAGAVNAFTRLGCVPSHPCSCTNCTRNDLASPPMLPQGSGEGVLLTSLYAIARQLGHWLPVAGFSLPSKSLIRFSKASTSLGSCCMRFQDGMRSSAFITSSSIPMAGAFQFLLWNFNCEGTTPATIFDFHHAGGAYAAGRARISSLLQWARNALCAVGGFFIQCGCSVHACSLFFLAQKSTPSHP